MSEPARLNKVLRIRILKPAGALTWKQLAKLLCGARYRVFRLANLVVSENYLAYHLWRTGKTDDFTPRKISALNKELRRLLLEESSAVKKKDGESDADHQARRDEQHARAVADAERYARKDNALPATICYALSQYKIRAVMSAAKWSDVVRGKASLPTFRADMAVPILCDKANFRRLERMPDGSVQLDLMLCCQPYPRVLLATEEKKFGFGARDVLDRLLANPGQDLAGYRQRSLEIKEIKRDKREKHGKWWLYVSYDFPAAPAPGLSAERVVGVDLGVSVPLYAAINHGYARLGRRQFAALAARVRSLQTQVMARRRSMQAGGRASLTAPTARGWHGRKRKLQPIERLEGRIHDAYTTLNHQLSAAVVTFAKNHGAGVIQIEDLKGLKDVLTGTFLGQRWRYFQLQQYLAYKAHEAGIELRKVNPKYTSRRCSACGVIHAAFDRAARDAGRRDGKVARFQCPNPECGFEADPDYNAARNLSLLDIEDRIKEQCRQQGLS